MRVACLAVTRRIQLPSGWKRLDKLRQSLVNSNDLNSYPPFNDQRDKMKNNVDKTFVCLCVFPGSESPVFGHEGGNAGSSSMRLQPHELPNEISAPYEVPQFPIEQIEKKLLIQRQLTVKWVIVYFYNFFFFF